MELAKCSLDKMIIDKHIFSELEATNLLNEITIGMIFLYKHNIGHRNIKQTNILMDKNN